MRIQQNRLVQAKLGVLELEDTLQIGGRSNAYRQPFVADGWARRGSGYPPEFQRYVEEHILVLAED